ncbi:MAG TPA: gephyrin-like molybdotransferase Glp [Vicinamibacterales bacterium]|nr:gephyrin-like molybdotransferase Glp [Vicinamibacterales bacterium]
MSSVRAMRPFEGTMPLDEARAIIDRTIAPIGRTERVRVLEASGRVLARDVAADVDVPPFSRAAMDGYAVRAADIAGASRQSPITLRCIEQTFTGQVPRQSIGPGQCIEVATGAPLPAGADAVVMVEDTAANDEGAVRVFAAVQPQQNIGRQGADIGRGQTVLHAGAFLNASRAGALSALGLTEVEVYAKPRVAILSTGDEIVDPGTPLAPGQIYDINKVTLSAVVSEHGGVPVTYRTAMDTLEDVSRAVDDCLAEDVLVFSGGSSVGRRDLIIDVIAGKGAVLFHGIAVKPGKPTAFGLIGGKPFFGMPGYPTSCLSNAYILLAPALRRIARLPPQPVRSVRMPLGARITSVADRHQFYSVRIADGQAMPAFKASGDITSMSQADGYIEVPIGVGAVDKGEMVDVTLF